MELKTILFEQSRGIATITLNRPEKRNAVSYELMDDLALALQRAAASDAQVLIITGAGKAFCAGMDLENLKALIGRSAQDSLRDSEAMARLFRSVYDFPRPTIAAVNGAAIAGGTAVATLCDFTLASEESSFGYTEVRIGFVPAIVSTFLIRQIGEKQARDLLLTGRIINPQEALRFGLINEIVPPARLLERARQLATELMANSPASLRATKQLLSGYVKDQLDKDVREAISENAGIRQTAEFREGVTAFLEKRRPRWQNTAAGIAAPQILKKEE